jgi:hypothetical protein
VQISEASSALSGLDRRRIVELLEVATEKVRIDDAINRPLV